mmetsp:Transcript_38144/g.85166  ORF Transcript_38144/g.85166 Transcript_38144/m.85166 type:complete len:385 (-) Transcript_38144:325-1479(-)
MKVYRRVAVGRLEVDCVPDANTPAVLSPLAISLEVQRRALEDPVLVSAAPVAHSFCGAPLGPVPDDWWAGELVHRLGPGVDDQPAPEPPLLPRGRSARADGRRRCCLSLAVEVILPADHRGGDKKRLLESSRLRGRLLNGRRLVHQGGPIHRIHEDVAPRLHLRVGARRGLEEHGPRAPAGDGRNGDAVGLEELTRRPRRAHGPRLDLGAPLDAPLELDRAVVHLQPPEPHGPAAASLGVENPAREVQHGFGLGWGRHPAAALPCVHLHPHGDDLPPGFSVAAVSKQGVEPLVSVNQDAQVRNAGSLGEAHQPVQLLGRNHLVGHQHVRDPGFYHLFGFADRLDANPHGLWTQRFELRGCQCAGLVGLGVRTNRHTGIIRHEPP